MKTRIIRSFVQTALLCLTISQLAGFANAQDAPKKADIPPAADKPALTKPAETPAAQTPTAGVCPYTAGHDHLLGSCGLVSRHQLPCAAIQCQTLCSGLYGNDDAER